MNENRTSSSCAASTSSGTPGLRAGALALAALVCMPLPRALAAGEGIGNGAAPGAPPSAPNEGIGSLPSLGPDQLPGMAFIGSQFALGSLTQGVIGTGSSFLLPLDSQNVNGLWVQIFQGELEVRLNRTILQSGLVQPLFSTGRAFDGGLASLGLGGVWSSPFQLQANGAVPFPIGGAALTGLLDTTPVSVVAMSPSSQIFSLDLVSKDGTIILSQQTR